MNICPLRKDLQKILQKYDIENKFIKQKRLFESDSFYPSLHTEKLQPTHLNIYSFRIDKKYRAIFIVTKNRDEEIIDINSHYQ